MTAFILLRALGPVEKTLRAASNPKRQSWVSGAVAQNFSAQLSTAGEQVPSCSFTMAF